MRFLRRLFVFGIGAIAVLIACGVIATFFNSDDSTQEQPQTRSESLDIIAPTTTPTAAPAQVEQATVAQPTAEIILLPTDTPVPAQATVAPTDTPLPALPTDTPIPTDTPVVLPAEPIAVANQNGNLRAGPGTDYEVAGSVAAGQQLQIVYKNPAGDWYQLGNGAWIAAFLVSGVRADVPIAPLLPAAPAPIVEQPAERSQEAIIDPPAGDNCDPAYPDVCIPPIAVSGDLDCGDVPQFARFSVLEPDPHEFDREGDGIGCETN